MFFPQKHVLFTTELMPFTLSLRRSLVFYCNRFFF